MNIVLMNITADQGISGVNRYMEAMIQGLKGNPDMVVHQVILLEKPNYLFHKIEIQDGIVKAVIPMPVYINPIVKEMYWLKKYSEIIADLLLPYFSGMSGLIWHTHCINLCALTEILKQKLGGKILTHFHCIPWKFNFEHHPSRFNHLYQQQLEGHFEEFRKAPIENLVCKVSDQIICVTKACARYLTHTMGFPPEKISVIPNGIEDCKKGKKTGRAKTTEILYVGRLSREKGIFALLDSLNQLKESGYAFRLNLVGAGHQNVVKTIQKNYSHLPIHFWGKIPFNELQKKYQQCTLGVIPSFHEQCSYVAIEMAMFGLPLIVNDVDGLAEMFEDGKTALKVPLIFKPEKGLEVEKEKLTAALKSLIDCPELRRTLSINVRKHYIAHFGLEKMIAQSRKVYQNLIN